MVDAFWEQLLKQRHVARWGNFNWFSVKTLLMTINDQVAKSIESGQPGSIVDRRRMRWVAAQRDRGAHAVVPLRLPDSSGVLIVGDPGEMDASQYVLVRDLGLVVDGLRDRSISTALLMSDIVYPAGDVNQWADAVYLPYFGLPRSAWKAAWRDYDDDKEPPTAVFDQWRVLAMPGNHDWYDGLNGFMFHACGAEPLPEVTYDEANLSLRQRLAKRSWRSPAAPERERITALRADAASMSPLAEEPAPVALALAGGLVAGALHLQADPIPPTELPSQGIPNLPGPYYAVDLGRHPTNRIERLLPDGSSAEEPAPVVRIVVVDTGITGTIDPEQATWLQGQLTEDTLPKVVVTGIPLLVDNKIHAFPISRSHAPQLPLPAERPTLQSLLKEGEAVVATVDRPAGSG